MKTDFKKFLHILERVGIVAGALLIVLAAVVRLDGFAHSQSALAAFEHTQESSGESVNPSAQEASDAHKRAVDPDAPMAVLNIPAVGIEVPVFNSTGKLILNRGAGHVEGTSPPGASGNIGIAGHRDTFFRELEDIQTGDSIVLRTHNGSQLFRVSEISIVDPLDLSVLDPTDETVLTLVTCYPFNYIGFAPERFIVRGVLEEADPGTGALSVQTPSMTAVTLQGE